LIHPKAHKHHFICSIQQQRALRHSTTSLRERVASAGNDEHSQLTYSEHLRMHERFELASARSQQMMQKITPLPTGSNPNEGEEHDFNARLGFMTQ
jgi:hypothetical protein